jgi:hypothetical protein
MKNTNNTNTCNSLATLYKKIKSLDFNKQMDKVSYSFTSNNKLSAKGFITTPFDNDWELYPKYSKTSEFASGINECVKKATTNASNKCFIDLSTLAVFAGNAMNTESLNPSIEEKIVNYINNLPSSVTPIVRMTFGMPIRLPAKAISYFTTYLYENVKNPKALIYLANVAPSTFIPIKNIAKNKSSIVGLLLDLLDLAQQQLKGAHLKTILLQVRDLIEFEKDKIATYFSDSGLKPTAWNHSKIFAFNGYAAMTGSGNYSPTTNTQPSENLTVLNMGVNLTGPAAGDTHRFLNQIWKYLENIPENDQVSNAVQGRIIDGRDGLTNLVKAPIYKDSTVIKTGNSDILSVSNVININAKDSLPSHIIWIIKDLFFNLSKEYLKVHDSVDEFAELVELWDEDNPRFLMIMSKYKINPAWSASRILRKEAVKSANSNVIFSTQTFDLDVKGYAGSQIAPLIDTLKKYFHINWNGLFVPYEVLNSLAYFIYNVAAVDPTLKEKQRLEILGSYYKNGWADDLRASEFKILLADQIKSLISLRKLPVWPPQIELNTFINSIVNYRRPKENLTFYGNHAKLVLIDNSLCYIGSDNVYPNYNYQHGYWFDDRRAINKFLKKYWTPLKKNFSDKEDK